MLVFGALVWLGGRVVAREEEEEEEEEVGEWGGGSVESVVRGCLSLARARGVCDRCAWVK
jgi:hypothetical protein